jgi:hypothetical protein
MSLLLFGVGGIAVVVGVVMAGFGIPVSEFSFGNTLISAGTTTAVGGLIVVGLGAVVSKLQQVADALATQAPIRPSPPLDVYEAVAGSRPAPAPSRIPFPSKPKPEAGVREPHPVERRAVAPASGELPIVDQAAHSFAPTLPNPDEPPVTVEEEVSLSPQHPAAAPAATAAESGQLASPLGINESSTGEARQAPTPQAAPAQGRQHSTYFDAMWPADTKPAKSPASSEAKPESMFDLPPHEAAPAPAPRAEPEAPKPQAGSEPPRAVAILKSGVVDGMGYTLYVDGSIEAELPQGTLRFASINELRSHLEKNS